MDNPFILRVHQLLAGHYNMHQARAEGMTTVCPSDPAVEETTDFFTTPLYEYEFCGSAIQQGTSPSAPDGVSS